MDDVQVIGVPPDISEATFVGYLREHNSPAVDAAPAVYQYAVRRGVLPSFLLSMMKHESSLGKAGTATITHSWGNTRQPTFGGVPVVRLTEPHEARSGQFPVFRNWTDGGISTVARFLEHTPYAGKTTVAAIIPTWAPATDLNVPERYIADVLATIAALRAREGAKLMGHVPRPPISNRIIGIPPKVDGVGVNWGPKRTPKFSVVHSMVGTLWGTDGWFRQGHVKGLTDFGIGITDIGKGYAEILQWCDIYGTLIPWASGPVQTPEGDGPRALATFGGADGVNRYGVSIELDDRGNTTTPVSAPQWSSLCWMLAWVHAELLGQTAATFDWNMHHHEFCGDDYKKCPFGRVRDHTTAYQEAVKAIMRHYQEGAPYPAGGLVVAGKRLALPPEGAVAPPVPAPAPGPAPMKPPWTYEQAQAYRRKYIMDTAEAMPARLRGPLIREGWVDLTGVAPGAVADERWAQFEKIRLHTIGTGPGGGRVEAFALEGPHSFEALKAAGKLGEF